MKLITINLIILRINCCDQSVTDLDCSPSTPGRVPLLAMKPAMSTC